MDPVTFSFLINLLPVVYVMPVLIVIVVCGAIDAQFPQPKAGSVWIIPRKVISVIGLNVGNAQNRIRPGSEAATIMPSDVMNAVAVNHATAQAMRTDLANAIDQVPGELNDIKTRVDTAVQATSQIKAAIDTVVPPHAAAP